MKEQSTTKGFAILSIAGLLVKVLSVLYIPFLRMILGEEGLGIYYKTYEVFVFIYAVANTGMQVAICKIVAELNAIGRARDGLRAFRLSRTILFFIGIVFTIILYLLAVPISELAKSPRIVYGIRMLSPTIVITSILVCYRGYFNGKHSMTSLAISQVVEQFINVLVSLGFAYVLVKSSLELGSAGGTVGTSVGALVACIYLIFMFKRKGFIQEALKEPYRKKRIPNNRIIKRVIRYGLPVTLSAGLANFGALIDMFNVTGRLIHAGFSEHQADALYGLLASYKTLLNVPLVFIVSLGAALLPTISKAVALKDRKEVGKNVTFALRMTYGITIPAAFGLGMLHDEVYTAFFGNTKGSMLMLYGSFLIVFMALNQIQSTILQSVNKFAFLLFSYSIGIIAKIIGNYIFVGMTNINVYGTIFGGIGCFLLPVILNHIKLQKTLRTRIHIVKVAIKPLIASVGMAISIALTQVILRGILPATLMNRRVFMIALILIYVFVGAVAYGFIMIYIRGIKKAEMESLSPRIYNKIPSFVRSKFR